MGANKKLNQDDLKQFVTADLVAKIASDKAELKKLKFNHAVSSLDNPASIHAKRRDIARLITELGKRSSQTK
jgi:large subunit ribosomal protein L29